MIHVKIVRHSERLDYSNPFYWMMCVGQFWADTPLTNNGYLTAREKGKQLVNEKFNPVCIYTSPYNRTMSTATELKHSFPESEIVIEPLLAEYQPSYAHHITLYPSGIPTCYEGIETNFSYPESYQSFCERVKFIIDKLIEKNSGDIIVVTHGEVLKFYISYLQIMYPDLDLKICPISYLTTLSFDYNKVEKKIDKKSVNLN